MYRRAFLGWSAAAAAAAVLGRPYLAAARSRWWSSLVLGVFENHGFDEVAGLPSHRRLAREGTVLARYSAVAHPSGPNYRALVSGATWGTAQTIETFHPSIASLAATLVPPIPTFVYHLEGEIARRHNPFLDLRAPVARVRHGLAALRGDLEGALPPAAMLYVGWDDLNNMHDGPPVRADQNLSALLDTLAASAWFTTPDREGRYPVLFFCYDEDRGGANRVFAAWWGRRVRRGRISQIPHTHYSFCRTVTDNWGLPPLARATGSGPITEPWS
jgi:acid phosphatase